MNENQNTEQPIDIVVTTPVAEVEVPIVEQPVSTGYDFGKLSERTGVPITGEDDLVTHFERYKQLEEQVKLPTKPTFETPEQEKVFDWISKNGYVENPDLGAEEFYRLRALNPDKMDETEKLRFHYMHQIKDQIQTPETKQIADEAFQELLEKYDDGTASSKIAKLQAIREASNYINSLKSKTVIPERQPDPRVAQEQEFLASHREQVKNYFSNKEIGNLSFKIGDETINFQVENPTSYKDGVEETSKFIAENFIKEDSGRMVVDVAALARFQMLYKNFDNIAKTIYDQGRTAGKIKEFEERTNASDPTKHITTPNGGGMSIRVE